MIPPELELAFEQVSHHNQNTARYYGIAIGGLIGLFTLTHWSRKLLNRSSFRFTTLAWLCTLAVRPFRRAIYGIKIGGFLVAAGHVALAVTYFAINLVLTFTNVDWSMQTFFAKRLGWMTLCNLCLVVFLGLKNTPLSPLAGYSYESINVLHRCCGYTTVLYVVLHAAIYSTGLAKTSALYVLQNTHVYLGMVAGVSMIIIFATAIGFVRRRQYELFYVVHVSFAAVILATAGFHVYVPPDVSPRTIVIIGLAAAFWVLDRSLRATRWIYYGIGNHCTLVPLEEGATRVIMHRGVTADPGSHVFLWIPGVRLLQTHPFTMLANEPVEFVVAARNGFTRALHEAAEANKDMKFRAAVEGPYGRVPSAKTYDKVILLAGGSGASFTIALALNWARSPRLRKHKSTLDFIWAVSDPAQLTWFEPELFELQACPAVTLRLYITQAILEEKEEGSNSDATSTHAPTATSLGTEPPNRKSVYWSTLAATQSSLLSSSTAAPTASESHVTRHPKANMPYWSTLAATQSSVFTLSSSTVVEYRRPDIDYLTRHALEGMPEHKKALVAACGPSGMIAAARLATSACMREGMPKLHVHIEEFGW